MASVRTKVTRCESCRSRVTVGQAFYSLYRPRECRRGPWLAELLCPACRAAMLDSELWDVAEYPRVAQLVLVSA